MVLFSNKSDDDPRQLAQEVKKMENEAISSIVDKAMTITGEIHFQGKARIDGVIEGNIDGEHLVLSEEGVIKGNVKVVSFNCYGSITGDIKADIVTARKKSKISGSLNTKSLAVEPGACIQGEIAASLPQQKEEKLLPDSAKTPAKIKK